MINIQTMLEKNGVYPKQEQTQFLVEFTGHKSNKNKVKQKLNLAFAIDISGSMDLPVNRERGQNPYFMQQNINPIVPNPFKPINPNTPWLGGQPHFNAFNELQMIQSSISKLEQAKTAAKKAISKMSNGDIISIVTFDDKPEVVYPSIELTDETKKEALKIIDRIKTKGSTNLHGGWLHGATEVAKKMSSKLINRVIVLTDGQANAGVTSVYSITNDVAGLYEKSISTTTFGIGEGFNEDLLQKMATAGGGNFYYIDDDTKLEKMFDDEFNGLSNICATEVKLHFEFKNDTQVIDNLNGYEKKDQSYLIPNIQLNSKVAALFKLKLNVGKSKKLNLGNIILSYKDEDGLVHNTSIEIKVPVVSKQDWDNLPNNEEIKVQETLLVIAKNKIAATQAIDMGNIQGARDLLAQSSSYASACGVSDSRIFAESATLDSTLLKASNADIGDLRKDLSYQSYQTRYSKK